LAKLRYLIIPNIGGDMELRELFYTIDWDRNCTVIVKNNLAIP
jgi:hypothetical protein